MNLKALMVAGVVALLFIPLTGGAGMEGSETPGAEMEGSETRTNREKPDVMGIIHKTAEIYKEDANRRATAHYFSAERHREWHVWLSAIAIIAAGLVTLATAVSRALASSSAPAGSTAPSSSSRFAKHWLMASLFVAFVATGATSWQTQRDDGGDVAKHQASMVGYENVKRGLKSFLLKLGLDNVKPAEALQQLNALMDQFNTVAQTSLLLTPEAYEKAAKHLQSIGDTPKAPPEADSTPTGPN